MVQGITFKYIIAGANDQSNLLERRQTVRRIVSLGKSPPAGVSMIICVIESDNTQQQNGDSLRSRSGV